VRPATLLGLLLLAACGTYSPLDSHYNRGVELYDEGKLADAIREYRMAIEDNPSNVRAHYNLAVAYHDEGKKADAAGEYEKVLKLDSDNARALVSLASLKADEGKDAEAVGLLDRAAAADRHSGFPKSALGAYQERKGDLDRALRAYQETSVELAPQDALVLVTDGITDRLATAADQLGQTALLERLGRARHGSESICSALLGSDARATEDATVLVMQMPRRHRRATPVARAGWGAPPVGYYGRR